MQNQFLQEISLLKLYESSVTMSVFCEIFWIQKMEKNSNECIFYKQRKPLTYGRLIARLGVQQYVVSK